MMDFKGISLSVSNSLPLEVIANPLFRTGHSDCVPLQVALDISLLNRMQADVSTV